MKEHLHRERFEGPLAMMWPVAILAVLATVAGWLQVPGGWALVDEWLDPVVESIPEASGGLLVLSIVASLLAAGLGILLAWRLYGRPSEAPARLRRRFGFADRVLEHKFYFDELYDRVFYAPSVALAQTLYRAVEKPLVLASAGDIGSGVRSLGRRVAAHRERAHPPVCAADRGRPRRHPRRLPGGAVGAHDLAHLHADGRRARPLASALELPARRRRRRARPARRAGAVDRRRHRLRLRRSRPAVRHDGRLVRRPRRLLQGRPVRLLALARRPHDRGLARGRRLRRSGRAATGRGPTSA